MKKKINSSPLLGFVVISNEIIKLKKSIGYFYREEPESPDDSGWRFFSGDESQDFADDENNFLLYNVSTIVDIEPDVIQYLSLDYPVEVERNHISGKFELIVS
ncbi:DUF2185 domain-containing protein [Glaciecola sp. MH2013]|uniref:DUF2185 domain-containing protein n=1 Tax=Glaciecola sp. MH2013 TaxID=2785524 RepID=UPI0018A075FB|nr:DUF2185 domain-containing protein [Glaciecola sp. MH2013]MBF7075000.1 DUF2185 domain-containing protein [Glaciecola sp. MH2013]